MHTFPRILVSFSVTSHSSQKPENSHASHLKILIIYSIIFVWYGYFPLQYLTSRNVTLPYFSLMLANYLWLISTFLFRRYTGWKTIFSFSRRPEKMVFPKKLLWNIIFLVLLGKMVFSSWKHDIFSLDGRWKIILLKKYMEIWYFLYIRTGVTSTTPCQKKQRWSYHAKINLKVIDMLVWHPRKGSGNSLSFYGDLYRRFHILLFGEKNRGA